MRSLASLLLLAIPVCAHWHENWWEGATFGYRWFDQPWVPRVRDFYCDVSCEARLMGAMPGTG